MRIVVLGAGESGAGAAVLAKVKGFDGLCCPKNQFIIIIRECKHFTSFSLA